MTKDSTPRPTAEAPPEMPDFDDAKVEEKLRRDANSSKPSKARTMAREFLKNYAPTPK